MDLEKNSIPIDDNHVLRITITDRGRGIIILRTNSPFGRRWRSNWEKVQMAPPARCWLVSRR
jgi:deferrochelatase/peroxidase EfeB